MGLDETDPTARESSLESTSRSRSRSGRRKSKSSIIPLASEDSLWNSHSSGCNFSEPEDENKWSFQVGYTENSKNGSTSNHSGLPSLASTNGSCSTNNTIMKNNNSNSNRSPRRPSKSPWRSPKPFPFDKSDEKSGHQSRQLPTAPFSSSERSSDDDRVPSKHERRHSGGNIGKAKEGKGLYYQPSKAALGLNNPTKKPQRVRSRSNSKGTVLRGRKDQHPSSQNNGESSSRESVKRSNSSEPVGKKTTPPSSRTRKKLSGQKTNTPNKGLSKSLHDHRPKPRPQDYKESERQRQMQKIKRKKPTNAKTKPVLGERDKILEEMISFFEDMATKVNSGPPPPRSKSPGRSIKKSLSAKIARSRSPASGSVASAQSSPEPGLGVRDRRQRRSSAPAKALAALKANPPVASEQSTPEPDLDRTDRSQRRSSAPAKALAAFNQYKKALSAATKDEDDKNGDEKASTPTPEKIMLDVSELAAVEVIRLGPDNSLKLDLSDLVKYLRRQQLLK